MSLIFLEQIVCEKLDTKNSFFDLFSMKILCDVPHRIMEQVPRTIYIETPLNQVNAF